MNEVIFCGLFVGGGLTALFFLILRIYEKGREDSELNCLRSAVRNCDSGILSVGSLQLKTRGGRASAVIASLLLARIREARRGAADVSELVLISKRIASGTDSPKQMATLALRLLAEHGGRDIAGAMLFRKAKVGDEPGGETISGNDHSWTTDGMTGAPQLERLKGILNLALERLEYAPLDPSDHGSTDLRWGFLVPRPGEDLDFSILGIGMSLFVPLMVGGRLTGAVWLGFRSGASGVDAARRNLIRALTEHLAASLENAETVHRRTDEAIGERDFLIGLSHDLRTPSTVALLAVQELLLDRADVASAVLVNRLQTIEQCLREQLEMLDDVLDLSRHRLGLISVQPALIGGGQIREIVSSFLPSAREKGILLEVVESRQDRRKEQPEQIGYAVADSNHFKRIVQNLISNALKYTDNGSITVRFYSEGERQLVEVIDTGRGIAAEDRPRLFQPYVRLKTSYGREGTGIGLAISRILAELNGGTLKHANRPGGGSIFSLALNGARSKIVRGAARDPGVSAESLDASTDVLTGLQYHTALIVDDDHAVCRMVRRILDGKVKQIFEASSLAQAIELAAREEPDLIITDYLLGDGTAADLFIFLESNERRGGDPSRRFGSGQAIRRGLSRHIVISGGSSVPVMPSAWSRDGGIRFLQKPISREQLLGAINYLEPPRPGSFKSLSVPVRSI